MQINRQKMYCSTNISHAIEIKLDPEVVCVTDQET